MKSFGIFYDNTSLIAKISQNDSKAMLDRWFHDSKYLQRGMLTASISCLLALLAFFIIDSLVIVGFNDPFNDFIFASLLFVFVYSVSGLPTALFSLFILYTLQKMKNGHHLTLKKAAWVGSLAGLLDGLLLCILFLTVPFAHNKSMILLISQESSLLIFYSKRIITAITLSACAGMSTGWLSAKYLVREG